MAGCAYLVQDVIASGKAHGLLEDVTLLLELDGLTPVIKGPGHEDLFSRQFPFSASKVSRVLGNATGGVSGGYHLNV